MLPQGTLGSLSCLVQSPRAGKRRASCTIIVFPNLPLQPGPGEPLRSNNWHVFSTRKEVCKNYISALETQYNYLSITMLCFEKVTIWILVTVSAIICCCCPFPLSFTHDAFWEMSPSHQFANLEPGGWFRMRSPSLGLGVVEGELITREPQFWRHPWASLACLCLPK